MPKNLGDADLRKGDVIQVSGPSVPAELVGKYYKVLDVHADGTVALSRPFNDAALSHPFHSTLFPKL
jgi:hypothetical protein